MSTFRAPTNSGPACDWSFDYDMVPNYGLVLRNVRHADYRLANDIRVAGVWIGTAPPGAGEVPKRLKLNDSAAMPLTAFLSPSDGVAIPAPEPFGVYLPRFSTAATFTSPSPIIDGGTEVLTVMQKFLFCPHGINPPHEPGAVLPAARMFPLVSFSLKGDGTGKMARYIRFDLRAHFSLDNVGLDTTQKRPVIRHGQDARAYNQAGIFRDNESAPTLVGVSTPASPIPGPTVTGLVLPTLTDVFAALEKPLKWEVNAPCLERGQPSIAGKPATWDNVHVWPCPYPGGDLPSTPGAFHCLHLHWRWGGESGSDNPSFLLGLKHKALGLSAAGKPQFKGLNWSEQQGGPLLDARIPDQTIQMVLANKFQTDTPDLSFGNADLSKPNFMDLFTQNRPAPQSVVDGGELVTWFSIEVFRGDVPTDKPWEGTVFIHGLYFAHDPEPSFGDEVRFSAISATAGTRDPGYKPPNPPQQWRRTAI